MPGNTRKIDSATGSDVRDGGCTAARRKRRDDGNSDGIAKRLEQVRPHLIAQSVLATVGQGGRFRHMLSLAYMHQLASIFSAYGSARVVLSISSLPAIHDISVIGYSEIAGRRSRPAGWLVVHVAFDSLGFGFGEDREPVRDEVNRVAGLAFDLVARLADAPGDADEIADCGVG